MKLSLSFIAACISKESDSEPKYSSFSEYENNNHLENSHDSNTF